MSDRPLCYYHDFRGLDNICREPGIFGKIKIEKCQKCGRHLDFDFKGKVEMPRVGGNDF